MGKQYYQMQVTVKEDTFVNYFPEVLVTLQDSDVEVEDLYVPIPPQ